jgi:hypothetical protein
MVSFNATCGQAQESLFFATCARLLGSSSVLNNEKVRSISEQARSHICACHAFEHTRNNNNNSDLATDGPTFLDSPLRF